MFDAGSPAQPLPLDLWSARSLMGAPRPTRLARLRRADGLTHAALAAQLKVDAESVASWEDGTAIPDDQLEPLARIFGVSVAWLTRSEALPSDVTRRPRRPRRFARDDRGQRIRRLRRAEGLSRSALAKAIGTSEASVADWESGSSLPDDNAQRRLAARLAVSIEYLMGRERLDSEIVTPDADSEPA
jgi:transcriptional regulator with XRE-family HTH domain